MVTAPPRGVFTVGSLSYTRAALVALFGWLIWGDFVLALMEQVLPALLPLLLKSHAASDTEIVIIGSTLGMAMNAALNPIISYNSDRFRSRWGRRRPFIVVTTPFVVFFLAAIPFAPEIFRWMNSHGFLARLLSLGPTPPLILVFALLVIGFQTFNMFISSVYSYLVPDVVPQHLVGRFFALFRLVGSLAVILFNYFIFGLATTHMKMIFVGIAVGYGFFILLMCWQVKEGEYPAPLKEDHAHWWSGIRNYARECFGHSYYWWVFLTYSALIWLGISNVFQVFFYRDEMGLSLGLIGKMMAWSSMASMVLIYPFGVVLDRWGCHKTFMTSCALLTAVSVLMFFFAVNQESTIVWTVLRNVIVGLASLALMKWTVDVYPRDRYGQFASAGALFSSIGGLILGPVCGWWIGWVHHYRFYLMWSTAFSILGLATAVIVYRKWEALGGSDTYRAP